jgi:hypothetical protein
MCITQYQSLFLTSLSYPTAFYQEERAMVYFLMQPMSLTQGSGSSYFATNGLSASPSWCCDQIFITVGHLRSSCYGAPSLTRGRVCNLLVQFAVTLQSKSLSAHDMLLSHLRLPQPGRPGPCMYIPQAHDCPFIPPGTGFPFCCLLCYFY